jgi:hypothetical protein
MDDQDGHRHRVLVLFDDGTGMTSIDCGDYVLPHAHNISGWVVQSQDVGGRQSRHPGTLYPPGTLSVSDDLDFRMAFARMLTPREEKDTDANL